MVILSIFFCHPERSEGSVLNGIDSSQAPSYSLWVYLFILFLFFSKMTWALCVQEPKNFLYPQPSLAEAPTWEVVFYTPLKKLKKENGWYQVEALDSQTVWIREDAVTTKYECAIIKEPWAWLRQGPGQNFPKALPEKGEKYLTFRVLNHEKDWVKVEDVGGDEYWVHQSLVWIQ